MQIKIKCKGSANKKLASLKILQGELKGLSDENRAKLRKRIEQYGFDAPFFVYKNYVLDGTQRLRVLQGMIEDGWTLPKGEVPVVQINADSIADAKERILGYVSQFGKLNPEGLSDFIVDLPDLDFDMLDLPDFDIEAFLEEEQPGNEGLTDPDDVPEPPKKAKTRPGQLWILGDHRLLCGDSTKKKDVERLMGGEKADMVFTDPPYGVDYDGGASNKKKRKKLKGDANTELFKPCCLMAMEHTKKNAPLYLWHAGTKGNAAAAAAAAQPQDMKYAVRLCGIS